VEVSEEAGNLVGELTEAPNPSSEGFINISDPSPASEGKPSILFTLQFTFIYLCICVH
jgi:hypothetical protein